MLRSNPLYDNAYSGGRWKELLRLFESFKSAYESKNGGSAVLGIDEVALYQAVTSYFHDVARYKWWHFPDDPKQHRIDDSKKSAYMVYWLNKLRPIYVERPSADPADLEASLNDDTSIIVNGQFALTVAYVYMNLMFSEELAEQLLYILTYRSTDPNALIFIFEMADAIRNKKDVIIT
jgi:hypothetical protein